MPARQGTPVHAHGRHGTMVTHVLQAILGQVLDIGRIGLCPFRVCVGIFPQIFFRLEGRRMFLFKSKDLRAVDIDILAFDEVLEFVQNLVIVVLADPRVDAVVPVMETANEIVPIDEAIRQQGTPVMAATVHDGYVIPLLDKHKVRF